MKYRVFALVCTLLAMAPALADTPSPDAVMRQIALNGGPVSIVGSRGVQPGDRTCPEVERNDCQGQLVSMTLEYTGAGCGSVSSEGSEGNDAQCLGGVISPGPVDIVVSNDGGDRIYADARDVYLGDVFEAAALNAGQLSFEPRSTVTIEDAESGEQSTYCIVGEHEADIKRGRISITAPVARALIAKSVGDEVQVKTPKGIREFEIVDVQWKAIELDGM